MIQKILPFIVIIGLTSCKQTTELKDFFGQTYPDSTPVIFAPDIISKKGRFEHGLSFTPDNRELAFGILNKDGSGEIFYSKKMNNNWTEPAGTIPTKTWRRLLNFPLRMMRKVYSFPQTKLTSCFVDIQTMKHGWIYILVTAILIIIGWNQKDLIRPSILTISIEDHL